ncbi:hypothetical protein AC579_4162 [Pseudocercospora musae]|uniref:Uncharacterized protein n=1 Tax=Pseudocercospora musae TaxID=113226 RepID=A0A139IFM8_9PEZI|nr:hypothetical protein AC579_4162 [Pseudocercospora musae]
MLTDADSYLTFHRLMDLPPELRNSIYELVMAAYSKPLTSPSQPPLALVSRQVRDEGCFHVLFLLIALLPQCLRILVSAPPVVRQCAGQKDFLVCIEKSSDEKYTAEVEALRVDQHAKRTVWCWNARGCADFKSCLQNFLIKCNLATGKKLTLEHIYEVRRHIEQYNRQGRIGI